MREHLHADRATFAQRVARAAGGIDRGGFAQACHGADSESQQCRPTRPARSRSKAMTSPAAIPAGIASGRDLRLGWRLRQRVCRRRVSGMSRR
jgi:hypothetical protein